MEADRTEEKALLDGIVREAERNVRKIEEEESARTRSRIEAAREQAAEILRKADETADAQRSAILRNAESRATLESRKAALRVRDGLIQDTLEAARREVAGRLGRPGYDEILLGWIVEAAVGLAVSEALVNASREELPRITGDLLRRAERKVEDLTGKPVRLEKQEGDPLPAQGVVLFAKGGRLAYNNQVPVRFLRAQSDIRKRMHAVLFGEGL